MSIYNVGADESVGLAVPYFDPWLTPFFRADEKTAQDLTLQLCDGVGYMHARGLMHRDIKPGVSRLTFL